MKNEIKFSENVILIDCAFFEKVACHIRRLLSERLGRELPDIDLPAWLSYLALDAGVREGENEIQVLLVHDEGMDRLPGCSPAGLKDLGGMACRTPVGEFAFSLVPSGQIVSRDRLFLDLTLLALDAARVKRLLLIPDLSRSNAQMEMEFLDLLEGKDAAVGQKAFCFTLEPFSDSFPWHWDFVSYSLARVLGIHAEEL